MEPHPEPVPTARDTFLVLLVEQVAAALEDVVGLDGASGFIGVVGRRVGAEVERGERRPAGAEPRTPQELAEALAALKNRIGGEFRVESATDRRIVLTATRCPFGERVVGHESLCQMTTSVFGVVAAEGLGYAAVDLQRSLARSDPGCVVVLELDPGAALAPGAREFLRTRTP